jgi:UDP-N-acetylmuramoyl-L-alanyl-D-glutamate--2,6-diaminopimelate ligase
MTGARAVTTSLLIDELSVRTLEGEIPARVTGITADSRQVEAGECFVAVTGFKQDGRRFIPQALARGAAMIVAEPPDPLPEERVLRVLVPAARPALARLAAAYWGHPSRAFTVVGITGTNGKTTTSYLVEALLRARGGPTGVIGTVQYRIGDETMPAGQTTPEAVELQAMLARMRDAGVTGVAMEVSSHALALHRVDGIEFDVAIFTNLTQDHLDFHGTFDNYRRAKRRLFQLLEASAKPGRTAVVNTDDIAGAGMITGPELRAITFGLGRMAMVRPVEHTSSMDGIRMVVDTPRGRLEVSSPLIGEHNVMNLLGAVGCGVALGLDPAVIGRELGRVAAVPGRFERVDVGQPFLVVVDYAHTPDALERVLTTARALTADRLGVVFGCGGDRDRGKRPIMGEIAARLADRVWVTSDNPRSERPEAIIDEIVAGIHRVRADADRYARMPDRHGAIQDALRWARAGDCVVIAGKGHETYQLVGSEVLPFDDRAVARELLLEQRKSA